MTIREQIENRQSAIQSKHSDIVNYTLTVTQDSPSALHSAAYREYVQSINIAFELLTKALEQANAI
jgi:hypothetical protein